MDSIVSIMKLLVIDRPIVRNLDVEVISPSYSNIPKSVQKDNGNIQALLGSRVSFNISSTKKLKEAKLEFADSSIVDLKVDGDNCFRKFFCQKR